MAFAPRRRSLDDGPTQALLDCGFSPVQVVNGQALPRLGDDAALVCVVDDDEDVRKGLARLFRSIGLAVETFPSPQAFLASPLADRPSCLVLDAQLPGQSGLELETAQQARCRRAGRRGKDGLHHGP